MYKKNRKVDTIIQVDVIDESDTSSRRFLLFKADSILNAFSRVFGKIFNIPIKTDQSIRSSRKSFKLNDPTAFNKNVTQRRPYIPARAILPPLCNKTLLATRKFITSVDEEEEVFCVLNANNEKEDVVKVYIGDPKNKQEIMKVYVDNDPPKQIVQRERSTWRLIPIRKRSNKIVKKIHFTGDGCKVRDPNTRFNDFMAFQKLIGKGITKEEKKNKLYDQEKQYSSYRSNIRMRNKMLKIPEEFF